MKTNRILLAAVVAGLAATSADAQNYTNWIRQVQVASGAEWDVNDIPQAGNQLSPLAIDPGGARFELWTINNSTLADALLNQVYVGTYVPQAVLTIASEDPYQSVIRTRADRPFTVTLDLSGMVTDPSAPAAARFAHLQHHVQSYGEDGNGVGLDRSLATLTEESFIEGNGAYTFEYALNTVPGDDRSKVRGEERFTVWSLPDFQVPPQILAAQRIQIWPVADGTISGVAEGDMLRFQTPTVTVTLNDLYPNSRTYTQVYKGSPALGTAGTVVPGSALVINDAVPQDRVLTLKDWDRVIKESGTWTMEILTETPFGIDRLHYVTFDINRDINVNGSVTTVE